MGLHHYRLRGCVALRIGSAAMIHDLWTRFYFFLEGEYLYYRRYLPELYGWLLFFICLAVLCFVLGFSAGVFWRIV